MMRPSYSADGQPFSMMSNIGLEGRLARLMALLQNPDLPKAQRDAIIREIAELQGQLADQKAKGAASDQLARRMPAPGQLRGNQLASIAAMISRARG